MIDALASVASEVVMGAECVIRAFAVVGRWPSRSAALARTPTMPLATTLGARVDVGNNAVVYYGVKIGDDTLIGDFAGIREGVFIGQRCVIGRQVTINYDAEIGDEVRIMDGSHITGGCKIGRGTFIGVGVLTSNDKRRAIVGYRFVGVTPPVIGERCLIGTGANILPGVTIGDGAVIGAGALVAKDVPAGATVLGMPATNPADAVRVQIQMAEAQRVAQYHANWAMKQQATA